MNNKINRINHSFVEEISYVIDREVKNQDIKFVTITAAKVTNDLSYAKIYFTVLDDSRKKETLKALNQASGFIRMKLFDRIDIRHMPKLEFIYDDSIEYGKEIEDKIKEIHKLDKQIYEENNSSGSTGIIFYFILYLYFL